jgi:ribosomal-protein-alanine N-acetyltransferase
MVKDKTIIESPDQTSQTFSESIECGDFVLRPFTENDAEAIIKILNNPKVREKLGKNLPNPYTNESFCVFFDKIKDDMETTYFTIDKNGELIGSISIDLEDNAIARLGYWLDEKYWGMGIMTKAINEIIKYGTSRFSLKKFYADTLDNNIGSEKVLIKNGFNMDINSGSFIKVVE